MAKENTNRSKIDASELALNDRLIYINRVTKVLKGGKRLAFSALVVTGDGQGHVGIGGGGKGATDYWVAVIHRERMLFELSGVDYDTAKEAMRLASYKLPFKTRFVAKVDPHGPKAEEPVEAVEEAE